MHTNVTYFFKVPKVNKYLFVVAERVTQTYMFFKSLGFAFHRTPVLVYIKKLNSCSVRKSWLEQVLFEIYLKQ